jgi:hypothetical protein
VFARASAQSVSDPDVGCRVGLAARPPPRTARTGCPAYDSSSGQRVRDRPRMASETAPAVDDRMGYVSGCGGCGAP